MQPTQHPADDQPPRATASTPENPLSQPQTTGRTQTPPPPLPPELSHDSATATPKPASTRPTSLPDVPTPNAAALATEVAGGQAAVTSSWSTSSERQLGYGISRTSSTADPSDRVFPIRSVISVDNDSQPTPWALPKSLEEQDYFPARKISTWDGRRRPSSSRVDTDLPEHGLRRTNISGSVSAGAPSPGPVERGPVLRRRRHNTMSDYAASSSPHGERISSGGPLPSFSDTASDISDRTGGDNRSLRSQPEGSMGLGTAASELNENLITTRFKHVVTEEGHAVITGRDGTLQRCEDEPIHTPGAVQSFGLLIVLGEEPDGRFTVRIVSENSRKIIGYSPQELFRLSSFTDILTDEQADNLLDHVDFIRDDESDPTTNGPDVFSINIKPAKRKATKLWCAIHINQSHPDLVICEFELEDDRNHPLRPPDELVPDTPEDTLAQNPTLEEFNESTEITSKPLRVLRSARKRRGEAGAMQVFDIMSQVQEQLAMAPNLDRFLKILVGIVKELTGFHRVMIYQFDAAFNGKVVTELVDPTHTRDLYNGLHFPASDIPKQARDLYKLNKVRLLYDRDLESARLVCRSPQELEQPLDLSHAYLRAMSPIHIKYLGNMAVRSSMSISINAFNELWGLIACHSYGHRGMRVPFPIRKMCRLVGDTASRNIERLSYASRLQARKLINTVPTDTNPSGYIIASSDDLLKLFDADFGMLSIRGETKILGRIEQSQEALAMLEYLRLRKFTSVITTQDCREDFPDLRYPPGFSVIAGLLYVPLSIGGHDFIVFFRQGQIREVKWAGNPYEKVIKEGTASYLEPRTSFKVWHETVVGKCREWTEEQVETAAVLCLVYGKFIEVWRQKEAALQSSKLTRLLLANSAHEVRTPLNAIINYLEIALEGSLDQETRDNLAKSHSASKSLIYVINDLLDLTKTEEGQELIKDEVFDLSACIQEATEPFKVDAKRKGIAYEVEEYPGLPRFVHGDQRRVRQALANMTANAVQHTSEGLVRVECYVSEVVESRVRVEMVAQDTGSGMSNDRLDALFRDLEQVSTDADSCKALDEEVEKPAESRTLGLGLAVVARIVRNMDGQLRLKSEEGKGSRFVIQLPFELPTNESLEQATAGDEGLPRDGKSSIASVHKTLPAADTGEVMLVDRGSSAAQNVPTRQVRERRSFDDANSISSLKSGTSRGSALSNKSDADRLIDAIQTPLALGEPERDAVSSRRQRSTGKTHHANVSTSSLPGHVPMGSPSSSDKHRDRPRMGHRSTTSPIGIRDGEQPPGLTYQADVKTPIKPVKVPDEYVQKPSPPQSSSSSKVLFEIQEQPRPEERKADETKSSYGATQSEILQVLVAEDDPVNMKILRKRLEKSGHHVYHAVNGEDCSTVYEEKPQGFDVVLMDMQMPIVDGLTSTKMIRAFEKSHKCSGLSPLAEPHGRVPIFAVSASLVEREKSQYIDAGFDGWILKPIDFKRLNTLLQGIVDVDVRNDCLYTPGEWERGGWFGPPVKDGLKADSDGQSSVGDAAQTGPVTTEAE